MKKRFALAGLFLCVNWPCLNQAGPLTTRADTLFTTPIAFIAPTTVNFGAVHEGEFATNNIVVENVGSGKLIGTATVAPPFRILSGRSYSLDRSCAQVVTIIYTPNGAPTNIATVTFSGGANEANATVTGTLSTKERLYYWNGSRWRQPD